jgi:hypothetical protein
VIHSKPTIQPDQGQNPKNNVKNKINSFIEKPKHRSDSEERKNRGNWEKESITMCFEKSKCKSAVFP